MLVILSTHPIQYQVPLWQALAQDGRVPFEVWYVTDHGTRRSHDPEFGKTFSWDLDTLDGYPHRFLSASPKARPGSFWQCRLMEDLALRLTRANAKALWVLGWQVAAYWQGAFAARRAGVELWLRGESNDLKRTSTWKRVPKRWVLGHLFRRVNHFLYIGSANRRLYEMYGVSGSQLTPAPYAVDNERFARQAAAARPSREALRRQWGIREGSFCVLFCGKFIAKKRPADLIKAARLMHDEGWLADIHLLFVGSGELGPELRNACTTIFDAENGDVLGRHSITDPWRPPATFAGFLNQKEISNAYVAADCLVLPSDEGETWGLVVNEALASGLPCVASTACGCTEDLITPLFPERTFEAGDIAGLAKAILPITRSPHDSDSLAQSLVGHTLVATVEQVRHLYHASRTKPNESQV